MTGVASVVLWLGSGVAGFLVVLNRRLSWLRDGAAKTWSIVALGACVLLASGTAAFNLTEPIWLWAPGLGIGLLVLGEVRRGLLRAALRGAPPVRTEGRSGALLRPFTTFDLEVHYYQVQVAAWPRERLRIVHLTDFHFNDRLQVDYFRTVIQRAVEADPDLVVLTGDFVSQLEFVPMISELLQPLKARHGVYAVLGNHDYWAGASTVRSALEALGIRVLGNGHAWVEVAGEGGARLALLGCEDPWNARRWQAPELPATTFKIALCHTGDNIYKLARAGCVAVFSGHYHGGQGRLPLFGAPVIPSKYGRRFDRGHFQVSDTHLFVSAGIGAHSPPLRVYCPPEVLVVDIEPT